MRLVKAMLVIVLLTMAGCSTLQPMPERAPQLAVQEASRELLPVIGIMFDWGERDLAAEYDAPLIPTFFARWDQFHVGPGQFSMEPFERYMRRFEGQTVTLATGEVIAKPVIIELVFYLSSAPDSSYPYDLTPQWVYDSVPHETLNGRKVGYVLTSNGAQASLPRYDEAAWREAWFEAVEAFADYVAQRPQVMGVVICAGIDTETQPTKNAGSYRWMDEMLKLPGVEYKWKQFMQESITRYGNAFNPLGVTVWLNNAPTSGDRESRAQLADAAGVKLKHSGGLYDNECALGIPGTYLEGNGSWEYMAKRAGTGTAAESAYGYMSMENRFWTVYAMLNWRPAAMTVHSGFVFGEDGAPVMPSWFLQWAASYVNAQPSDGRGWIVFRDAEDFSAGGACATWPGDFAMFVTAIEEGRRVWPSGIPGGSGDFRSHQARAGKYWMLDADPQMPSGTYTTYLTILDYAGSVTVRWRRADGTWASAQWKLNGSGAWVGIEATMDEFDPSWQGDLEIVGSDELYLHGVEIERQAGPHPLVTQTPGPTLGPSATVEPTNTSTPQPTHTSTPWPTNTSTPTLNTATPYSTETPSATPYPTYTPLPTYTPYPTATALSLEDHLEMAERMLADQNPSFDVRLKVEMERY